MQLLNHMPQTWALGQMPAFLRFQRGRPYSERSLDHGADMRDDDDSQPNSPKALPTRPRVEDEELSSPEPTPAPVPRSPEGSPDAKVVRFPGQRQAPRTSRAPAGVEAPSAAETERRLKEELAAWMGENRALLVRRIRPMCKYLRTEPEDLVQDAMVSALKHWELLARIDEPARLAWMIRGLKNRVVDHVRRRKTESNSTSEILYLDLDASRSPGEEEELQLWRLVSDEDLLEGMEQLLPERLRIAFKLYREDMAYKDIASQLGVPLGTVCTWIRQAKLKLRAWLIRHKNLRQKPGQDEGEEPS